MDMGVGEVKEKGPGARLRQSLAGLGRLVLDQLYPPACIACQAPLMGGDSLCPECFVGLRQITAPFCPVLGIPFDADMGPEARSAEALADPRPSGAPARRCAMARLPGRWLAGSNMVTGRNWRGSAPG
jgi:hypothetical protein